MKSTIFNFAQSFLIDPASVKNAKTVDVSSVDLYFKSKPSAIGNKSGITDPGVYIFLCEMTPAGVPDILPFLNGSHLTETRVSYNDIRTSSDASLPTKLKFEKPIKVPTNKNYAIVGIFEGNESFTLWTNVAGDNIVGTNKPSPGSSGKYVGNYFASLTVSQQASLSDLNSAMNVDVIPTWNPSTTIDLKFNINLARYSIGGVPVGHSTVQSNLSPTDTTYSSPLGSSDKITYATNAVSFKVSPTPYEFVTFDRKYSLNNNVFGGELVYQNTVFYPGGSSNAMTISTVKGSNRITANNNYPNGASFNWSDVYDSINGDEYIVTISLNGSTGRKTDIRKITNQISNTVIEVDKACGFTNSSAYFIKSPVAKIDLIDRLKIHNFRGSTLSDKRRLVNKDLLILKDSNANSTVRFVNSSINSISISTPGTGYTNSDYVLISGFENSVDVAGGYNARANIVANVSTGAIENVYLSNVGAGFSNVANIGFTITRATGSTVGTTGNFTFTTGTVLRSEYDGRGQLDDESWGLGGRFNDCNIVNIDFYDYAPRTLIKTQSSSKYNMRFSTPYYAYFSNYTDSGIAHRMTSNANILTTNVRNLSKIAIKNKNTPIMVSRSNEFAIIQDGAGVPIADPHSGGGYTTIDATSNNDFVGVVVEHFTTSFSKFDINSDYSDEHTDFGNAASKHITKKINFIQDKKAEDLLVYISAYRPLNTDIKVFARLHNSNDPEAFDDKNWTMLELKEPTTPKYSSSTNTEDFFEMQFGLQNSPNTAYVYAGKITVENTSTVNVTGIGTSFTTNAINIVANTTGFSNTSDTILISSANVTFQVGDRLFYGVPTSNTPIAPLTGNTYFYVSFANSSAIKITDTAGGANINLTDIRNSNPAETHTVRGVDKLQVNDLVKIYDPLFPNTYAISVVSAVTNNIHLSLSSPVGTLGPTGVGLNMDLIGRLAYTELSPIGYPMQAFNNRNNGNVARYYSSSMIEYDTFDTMQLKVVFLADVGLVSSNSSTLIPTSIPRIDDIRAVGVSA